MELNHIGYSCRFVVFVVNAVRQSSSCDIVECIIVVSQCDLS